MSDAEAAQLLSNLTADRAERREPAVEGEAPWEMILRLVAEIPREEFKRLPRDGAANLDHYIYGAPRRG
jgi:hypothetical protein